MKPEPRIPILIATSYPDSQTADTQIDKSKPQPQTPQPSPCGRADKSLARSGSDFRGGVTTSPSELPAWLPLLEFAVGLRPRQISALPQGEGWRRVCDPRIRAHDRPSEA